MNNLPQKPNRITTDASGFVRRLALEKYPNVRLIYIHIGSHHKDSLRFKDDCEKWYGKEIELWQSKKYDNQFDVIRVMIFFRTCAKMHHKKQLIFSNLKINNYDLCWQRLSC